MKTIPRKPKIRAEEVELDERVKLSKPADKYLKATDRVTRNRLRKAINGLTSPGVIPNTTAVLGTEYERLKVGQYRVLYQTFYSEDRLYVEVVEVRDIGPRGQIYKNL